MYDRASIRRNSHHCEGVRFEVPVYGEHEVQGFSMSHVRNVPGATIR